MTEAALLHRYRGTSQPDATPQPPNHEANASWHPEPAQFSVATAYLILRAAVHNVSWD
jgi:hypothetical protein